MIRRNAKRLSNPVRVSDNDRQTFQQFMLQEEFANSDIQFDLGTSWKKWQRTPPHGSDNGLWEIGITPRTSVWHGKENRDWVRGRGTLFSVIAKARTIAARRGISKIFLLD